MIRILNDWKIDYDLEKLDFIKASKTTVKGSPIKGKISAFKPGHKNNTKFAKYLKIHLSQKNKNDYIELCSLLQEYHGSCPVIIEYESEQSSGRIPLSEEFDVSLDRELLDSIEKKLGNGKYKINY